MAWWPSSRGLTGFASAVLRALFDGFGMVASGAVPAALSNSEGGEHRTLRSSGAILSTDIKKVPRLNKLTHESAMNGR